MTKNEIIDAIVAGIRQRTQNIPAADARDMAQGLLAAAVIKIGRMPAVSWNRRNVEFSFTSGKSSYETGKDIFGEFTDIKNIQYIWITDSNGSPVKMYSLQEFNRLARGLSSSGKPRIATMHSDDETLEVYPVPDSDYNAVAYVQRVISKFDDIPVEYHDLLVNYANASYDTRTSVAFFAEGKKEAQGDTLTRWDGNTIRISRGVGDQDTVATADSGNLRGD